MSLKKALLAATILSLPVVAQAQPVNGLYIGAGAGANYRERGDATTGGGVSIGRNPVRTNWGYAALGSIGWGFGNGLRLEIEGNYRNNGARSMVGAYRTAGTVHQYGVMGNALYDFAFLNWNVGGVGITPYLGAGVGYVWNDWRNVRGDYVGGRVRINDRDGQLAYQGIAGVAFGLDRMVPGLAVTGEYRFMGSLEPRLNVASTVGTTTSTSTFKPENYNHSILVGLRLAFNAPRPAPIVAPAVVEAPPVARTYLVFFDWNRADLTDRARQIIAEAANNARSVGSTRIEVSGHADRTGSAAYNQRLSVRRAEVVAGELVRRGVNRNEIGVQGFGFDRPLVPTAMGVREPQNRRVEIVLR